MFLVKAYASCTKHIEVNLKKAFNDAILRISLWTMVISYRVCDYDGVESMYAHNVKNE